ncbi:MAG: hypothetical protein EBU46_12705 [Nitrosomonadaceae bacterium]|nr:hypothetical protein [Nitrosomonadaceae bacterium]
MEPFSQAGKSAFAIAQAEAAGADTLQIVFNREIDCNAIEIIRFTCTGQIGQETLCRFTAIV